MSDLVQLTDAEIELVSGGVRDVDVRDVNIAVVNQLGLAIAVNVLSPGATAIAAVSNSVRQRS
jgi:hypothetical protein